MLSVNKVAIPKYTAPLTVCYNPCFHILLGPITGDCMSSIGKVSFTGGHYLMNIFQVSGLCSTHVHYIVSYTLLHKVM